MTDPQLYKKVANHLTGRDIELHFVKPYIKGARGCAIKKNGKPVIFVDPVLDEEQKLKTFLHECAHVAAPSWVKMAENRERDFTPGRLDLAGQLRPVEEIIRPMEKDAEAISKGWFEYATNRYDDLRQINRKANFYIYGFCPGRSIEDLLKILMEWKG